MQSFSTLFFFSFPFRPSVLTFHENLFKIHVNIFNVFFIYSVCCSCWWRCGCAVNMCGIRFVPFWFSPSFRLFSSSLRIHTSSKTLKAFAKLFRNSPDRECKARNKDEKLLHEIWESFFFSPLETFFTQTATSNVEIHTFRSCLSLNF